VLVVPLLFAIPFLVFFHSRRLFRGPLQQAPRHHLDEALELLTMGAAPTHSGRTDWDSPPWRCFSFACKIHLRPLEIRPPAGIAADQQAKLGQRRHRTHNAAGGDWRTLAAASWRTIFEAGRSGRASS